MRMVEQAYKILAEWDEDSEVWIATSEDIPGLVTGADTFEELLAKLRVAVPDMLEANGLLPGTDGDIEVPYSVVAERLERVRRSA